MRHLLKLHLAELVLQVKDLSGLADASFVRSLSMNYITS